jgi:hypothetical protein
MSAQSQPSWDYPGEPPRGGGYPVSFTVDYPAGPRNRATTFFRLLLVIPIAIVLGLVSGESFADSGSGGDGLSFGTGLVAGGGLLFLAPLLLIVFREKYPRWWFDWNLALLRFENRVAAYLYVLRDEYPSTDEEQAVHLEIPYPQALNRWLPLVKWLLAIPHYFILFFLGIAVCIVVIIGWFAILFTGRFPQAMFDFVVGYLRWGNRVIAYAIMLATDEYPPFSLAA